jgi:hypothetical protein
MNGTSFKSEHVEADYKANDIQGAFAICEHFFAQSVPCVPYANDSAGTYAMKRPDLLVDGLPVEVQVSRSWGNQGQAHRLERNLIYSSVRCIKRPRLVEPGLRLMP